MINEDIEIRFGEYLKLISYAQEIPQGRRRREKGKGEKGEGRRRGRRSYHLLSAYRVSRQGSKYFPCNISFNVKQTLSLNYYYSHFTNEVSEAWKENRPTSAS